MASHFQEIMDPDPTLQEPDPGPQLCPQTEQNIACNLHPAKNVMLDISFICIMDPYHVLSHNEYNYTKLSKKHGKFK